MNQQQSTPADANEAAPTNLPRDAWLAGLRGAVARWRSEHHLPDVERADALLQALVEVQGAGFAAFVQEQAPTLIAEREAASGADLDPDDEAPALIWITDDPGLCAADLMLDPEATHLLAAPEAVFDTWAEAEPDWACRYHLEYISLFAPLEAKQADALSDAERALAAQTPDGAWLLHRVGLIWGDGDGHETQHLWRWHDEQLQLVQPSWGGAVVS